MADKMPECIVQMAESSIMIGKFLILRCQDTMLHSRRVMQQEPDEMSCGGLVVEDAAASAEEVKEVSAEFPCLHCHPPIHSDLSAPCTHCTHSCTAACCQKESRGPMCFLYQSSLIPAIRWHSCRPPSPGRSSVVDAMGERSMMARRWDIEGGH